MPDFTLENKAGGVVAGIDEAGRGPWAGPVVAAAVIFMRRDIDAKINDSKKLSATARSGLFEYITRHSYWALGQASVEEIDRLNILQATKLAMHRAYEGLPVVADVALVDGNQPPLLSCKVQPVVKGDSKSLSIAAASILAKVMRDRIMARLAIQHPHYGWERNAGYGTKLHIAGIEKHGITPHHRQSFAPIRAVIKKQAA